jgi:2-C-methyl-D-erythritol 2,4-cyclodiphosphate synthase
MTKLRVGQGFDIHRLVPEKVLKLGGIVIPFHLGSEAHSDGDVLLHALIDALLGAANLGDIGEHFPPSDPQYKNADSLVLLAKVKELLTLHQWDVGNIDATVFLEQPKLLSFKPQIQESIAISLGLELNQVSIKAKTAEKLGPVGNSEAVAASVVVLLNHQS